MAFETCIFYKIYIITLILKFYIKYGGDSMRTKSLIYKLLRISNDINAVKRGCIGRRIGRRVYGKVTGRLARKIFK